MVYLHGPFVQTLIWKPTRNIRKPTCKLFLDQTQKTTQEILAGEDLRNSLDNHKQLEEVLSVMGKGLEIFKFRLLRTDRIPCILRRFISLNISNSCKCGKRIGYWTPVQTILGKNIAFQSKSVANIFSGNSLEHQHHIQNDPDYQQVRQYLVRHHQVDVRLHWNRPAMIGHPKLLHSNLSEIVLG